MHVANHHISPGALSHGRPTAGFRVAAPYVWASAPAVCVRGSNAGMPYTLQARNSGRGATILSGTRMAVCPDALARQPFLEPPLRCMRVGLGALCCGICFALGSAWLAFIVLADPMLFRHAWDRNLTDSDGPYIELMAGQLSSWHPACSSGSALLCRSIGMPAFALDGWQAQQAGPWLWVLPAAMCPRFCRCATCALSTCIRLAWVWLPLPSTVGQACTPTTSQTSAGWSRGKPRRSASTGELALPARPRSVKGLAQPASWVSKPVVSQLGRTAVVGESRYHSTGCYKHNPMGWLPNPAWFLQLDSLSIIHCSGCTPGTLSKPSAPPSTPTCTAR